jgi:hypothetical protein
MASNLATPLTVEQFAASTTDHMPIAIPHEQPAILIRRTAFEERGLTRSMFDELFGLTAEEFRVEGDLIAIAPLPPGTDVTALIDQMEGAGLVYFDDFFDLSGNWPSWLKVFAMSARA